MKASEAMTRWAGDFIAMTDDPQEKHGRLRFAVSAWNLACLPWKKRKAEMTRFLIQSIELSPTIDPRALRHDLELLVEDKLRMFPDDRRRFLSASAEKDEQGNDAIAVVFMPTD